ncbi:sulfatase [Negadavirga shengliensis]|uniref:Sulfatase n=1 Tax=Negadavirga shengliensis TaxID=1389218 RepID=A0ABV9T203_9BACT
MRFRIFALGCFVFIFHCIGAWAQVTAQDRVNVILIHVDDLGWTDLSSFGSDYFQTPHIDRLAAEGVKFTQSYAAAAICSPSRVALLTGQYPARTGITDWIRAKFQGGDLPADGSNPQGYDAHEGKPLKTPQNYLYMPLEEVTLAELLQESGYRTAHIGKWHLGPEGYFPENQGFDENYGGCDLGQPPSYFDPYLPPNEIKDYVIPNLPPRKEGEYLTDREGDEAVGFIQRNRDQPFFLHWAPYAVHTPIQAREELIQKYEEFEGTHHSNPIYAAMIEDLDNNVGKVLDILEQLNLRRNTLVIFTSDNGGFLGMGQHPHITSNQPLRSGKGYPYEGGIRVPTIMSWPGVIPQGETRDMPIITMDMMPTVLEYTGNSGKLPATVDGTSLVNILNDPGQKLERDLFWHFPHYRQDDVVPYSIIRSENHKLIYYHDGSQAELYHLSDDLKETHNLAFQNPEMVQRLQKRMENWLAEVNARLPQ